MALKFNLKSFEELDTPNLLINIWSYSTNLIEINLNCNICKTYGKYCMQIVRGRWIPEWGKFNKVMKNITINNENFINLSKYSSDNRYQILTDLKRIERYGFV